MVADANEMNLLVRMEMNKIQERTIRDSLLRFIIYPFLHQRSWDYGSNNESFDCWLVAKSETANLGIVYSEYGHGPSDPWGIVNLDDKWYGRDDFWFVTLKDAFVQSGLMEDAIPEDYEIE